MGEEEKSIEEKICSVCNKKKAVLYFDGKGRERYNFSFHIINGEQETVCMDCKMKLLQNKRPCGF